MTALVVGTVILLIVLTGLVWVVGGNALIGSMMSGVHRDLRKDLSGQTALFEELAVPATMSTSAMLSWSRRWVTADLLVTDRSAVLFQRNRFIAQPPIQLLRSADDPASSKRSMVSGVVVSDAPRVEDGSVVILGRGRRIGKWKLVLKTKRPEELVAALARWADPREGAWPPRTNAQP